MVVHIIKKYKIQISILCIMSFLAGLISIIPMLIIENMFDYVSKGDNIVNVLRYGFLYLLLVFFHYSLRLFVQNVGDKLDSDINTTIRGLILNKVVNADQYTMNNMGKNEVLMTFLDDIKELNGNIIKHITKVFYTISSFVLGLIIMINISPIIVIVVIPLSVFGAYMLKISMKKNNELSVNTKEIYLKMWKKFSDGIICSSVIKSFNKNNMYLDLFNKLNKNTNNIEKKHISFSNKFSCITDLLFMFIIGLLFIIGCVGLINNSISIGGLIAILMYNHMLTDPIFNLIENQKTLSRIRFSIRRIEKVYTEIGLDKRNNYLKFEEIVLKNVGLQFNKNIILDNFNLTIKNKDKVLITGKTGCGKSSIVKLITSIYTPTKGDVLIDNKSTDSLRITTSYLPQDPQFFQGSIIENIKFVNSEISNDKLNEILDITFVTEIIDKYNEQNIGENGVYLSGGEKKRIALARCLAYECNLYIFDELSAGLDKEIFNSIFTNLLSYLNDKTVIFIEHEKLDNNYFTTIINV